MIISEAMGITGLTKKAINYYEEEGLLAPPVNSENNYRDYSVEDVNRLIQISILRQLNVPVKEIKEVLSRPESLKEKLQSQIRKLDNDISRLNKCRNIIDACISEMEEDNCTLTGVTKKLSVLNEALKMDDKSKIGYMKTQLLRIFPGNFGKVMFFVYGSFLNETVNTPEKDAAWLSLVKLMDEAEPVELTGDISSFYSDLSEEDLIKQSSIMNEYIGNMINPSEEFKEELRKSCESMADRVNNDINSKEQLAKIRSFKKSLNEQLNTIKFNERLDQSLRILSSDYCKYVENMDEITKTIDIKVDDSGNITVSGNK
jgi:DNA-binding transcriptional MerR regulator